MRLNEQLISAVKDKEVIAATDALSNKEFIAGAWMIEEDSETVSEEHSMWSNK